LVVYCASCGKVVKTVPNDNSGRSQTYGCCSDCDKTFFRSGGQPGVASTPLKPQPKTPYTGPERRVAIKHITFANRRAPNQVTGSSMPPAASAVPPYVRGAKPAEAARPPYAGGVATAPAGAPPPYARKPAESHFGE